MLVQYSMLRATTLQLLSRLQTALLFQMVARSQSSQVVARSQRTQISQRILISQMFQLLAFTSLTQLSYAQLTIQQILAMATRIPRSVMSL